MTRLFGYEDYSFTVVSYSFFEDRTQYGSNRFEGWVYDRGYGDLYLRIPEQEPIWTKIGTKLYNSPDKLKQDPTFADRHYIPAQGETLFFDKACTIPRMKCEGMWKRSINLIRANVAVIPDPVVLDSTAKSAIFKDDVNKRIYFLESAGNLKFIPMVGMTIEDLISYHPMMSQHWKNPESYDYQKVAEALSAKCVYVGPVIKYREKDKFMFTVLEGLYPRIVYESDLLARLGDENNKLDASFVENLISLLNSSDKESVYQGMRVLAELDYTHYPSITKWILSVTKNNWEKYGASSFNSAVRFMLKELKYREGGLHRPFANVSHEEFLLAKDIFEEIINMRVKNCIDSLRVETNMTLDTQFSVSLSLNTPVPEEQEEPEEDCPDCPDPSEIDFSFANQ